MNIVFALPGLGFGGAERVVSILANEFAKEHTVKIILTSGRSDCAYSLSPEITVEPTDGSNNVFKNWKSFRKICKESKPDVVISFMTVTGIMSAIALAGTNIPIITSERNDPFAKSTQLSTPLKILGKLAPFFTAGYVFQSEGAKNYYSTKIQKKSCIILNPLNVEKLPTRDENNIDNRIVSVGRLHPQKNQKMLINAFARSQINQDHTLHIYGDGPLKNELEELIETLEMKNKIFLEGNSKQVHEDIKNAKLFVFTSDYEGLPNALMEAMAIGLPCISTDCSPGGAKMLINNGENGILIPCGDEDLLMKELDSICNDKERLDMYGAKAKTICDKTKISSIANEWMKNIKIFTKTQGDFNGKHK